VIVAAEIFQDVRLADVHLVPDGGDNPEIHHVAQPGEDPAA
jgi:hypothetical protein